MPYHEDGETWNPNVDYFEEGMAENKPGHKKFSEYQLPSWAKHPLSHPYNGMVKGPQAYYMHAGDGFVNPMNWSIAHVAAKFGDLELLKMATDEELIWQTVDGDTPAMYAVIHGTPWCLQWMVEKGVDVKIPNKAGYTPEEQIWRNNRLQNQEMEWCYQAIQGELSEKNNVKAQEFRLTKMRSNAHDDVINKQLDKDMRKHREFWYHTIEDYPYPYKIPTPEELEQMPLDLPSATVAPIEKAKPPVPVALLFPGQGSQYVGMLKDVAHKPAVKEMLDVARGILGWDPRDLCLNGPESKLSSTRHCQPIMVIAGLAALEELRDRVPEAVERPMAVAGLSLGEYTALVAAGVFEFEDAIRLVKIRAEAMEKAIEMEPQAMCSVAGLDRAKVDTLCAQAKKSDPSEKAECKVSNFLFPSGFTCAGTRKAVDNLCVEAMKAKALQARVIKNNGAFHTRLMEPASEALFAALDELEPKMNPPRCSVYFNVTGKRIAAGTPVSGFMDLIKEQLMNEALWEPCVKSMIMDGVKDFYEVGPLKQLKAMIKRIDADAFKRTENINV